MDDVELSAIVRVNISSDFKIVKEYLKKRLSEYDVKNRNGEGIKGAWIQGRSQELNDLLNLFESSKDEISK